MNRNERRDLLRTMRKQSEQWPQELTPVPREQWPARPAGMASDLFAVWRSRHYLAQLYEEQLNIGGRAMVRMSVNRVTLRADGRWEDGISWDELMRCKREVGLGDWYGVEVYPRDKDIVNDANMRHLWLLSEPLPIGWF